MMTLISTDFIAIIALGFLVNLAMRNVVINPEQNRIYIYAVLTTIIILIMEVLSIFMEFSSDLGIVTPYRIANIIGFSLSPVVPFFLYMFFSDNKMKKRHRFIFALPLIFNALICILSFNYGIVFFVNVQNLYSRGPLFLMPTLISLFYYILFMIVVLKNTTSYEHADKKIIFAIYLLPILGMITQIMFKDMILLWSSVSISLLLYYTFLLELQFQYDVQTKIKNRAAFEKKMQHYLNGHVHVTLVMFDLNNLKATNDLHGHKAGDEMIYQAAKIINESFMPIGTAYRIGGDEFCVLCEDVSKGLVDEMLSRLDEAIIEINKHRQIKITIAHGYAFYDKYGSESIYTVLSHADKAMYTNKLIIKGLGHRRAGD